MASKARAVGPAVWVFAAVGLTLALTRIPPKPFPLALSTELAASGWTLRSIHDAYTIRRDWGWLPSRPVQILVLDRPVTNRYERPQALQVAIYRPGIKRLEWPDAPRPPEASARLVATGPLHASPQTILETKRCTVVVLDSYRMTQDTEPVHRWLRDQLTGCGDD